jgi:hypothetical protein
MSVQWQPRPGWGTIRDYKILSKKQDGTADISFRFVPDDGSEPRLITMRGMTPFKGLGEYARGIAKGDNVTIKATPEALAKADRNIFQRINGLELSERMAMYADRNDLAADAGWAWTSHYTLVKVAPGLAN